MGILRARPPCCRLRKTDNFARTVSKTNVLGLLAAKTASGRASWRPRQPPDGPPGAQDGLQTGFLARKTASDGPPGAPDGFRMGLLWRPRRPPDRPPGAQVGLWTGLLTPQTASDGPSPADKFTCRQDHLPTSPPADKSALAPSEPSTPALFCRSRRTAVTACLTRQPPDELSCMSTLLHVNLLPSHYATGSH